LSSNSNAYHFFQKKSEDDVTIVQINFSLVVAFKVGFCRSSLVFLLPDGKAGLAGKSNRGGEQIQDLKIRLLGFSKTRRGCFKTFPKRASQTILPSATALPRFETTSFFLTSVQDVTPERLIQLGFVLIYPRILTDKFQCFCTRRRNRFFYAWRFV
jgi:hypothetical protein